MPSVSKKQHRFMEAADHDAGFARKVGIPQKVAREFVKADEQGKQGNSNIRERKSARLPPSGYGR